MRRSVLLDFAELGELLPRLVVQRGRSENPNISGLEPDRSRTPADRRYAEEGERPVGRALRAREG